jgi:hypothetical protein
MNVAKMTNNPKLFKDYSNQCNQIIQAHVAKHDLRLDQLTLMLYSFKTVRLRRVGNCDYGRKDQVLSGDLLYSSTPKGES